jgi:hypothetical protein
VFNTASSATNDSRIHRSGEVVHKPVVHTPLLRLLLHTLILESRIRMTSTTNDTVEARVFSSSTSVLTLAVLLIASVSWTLLSPSGQSKSPLLPIGSSWWKRRHEFRINGVRLIEQGFREVRLPPRCTNLRRLIDICLQGSKRSLSRDGPQWYRRAQSTPVEMHPTDRDQGEISPSSHRITGWHCASTRMTSCRRHTMK